MLLYLYCKYNINYKNMSNIHCSLNTLTFIDDIKIIDSKLLSKYLLAVRDNNLTEIAKYKSLDEEELYDGLIISAILGYLKMIKLLVSLGAKPDLKFEYDSLNHSHYKKYTILGHAVENNKYNIVKYLLESKYDVNHFSHSKYNTNIISFYFNSLKYNKKSYKLLRLLLKYYKSEIKIYYTEIFNMIWYGTYKKTKLLLNRGLDPNLVFKKSNTFIYQRPEISILTLAVMKCEYSSALYTESEYKKDKYSLKLVKLLLDKKANITSFGYYGNNYLHYTTHPDLVKLLCEYKIDVNKKGMLSNTFEHKITYSPISVAYSENVIKILLDHGANKEECTLYNPYNVNQELKERSGLKNKLDLESAFLYNDIVTFISAIANKIDLNKYSEWPLIHKLYSNVSFEVLHDKYDYIIDTFMNYNIKIIKLLHYYNIQPIKDKYDRTPLTCLTFNDSMAHFNYNFIEQFGNYEAKFYKIDTNTYITKLNMLRRCGFTSSHHIIKSVFDDFWNSIKYNTEFNPTESEFYKRRIEDWNEMCEVLK